MMTVKRTMLWFEDCYAEVEMELQDVDSLTITVSELDRDEEKSKDGHEVLKKVNTAEIYIGVDEAREIVRALQFLLPKEDK